MRRPPTQLLLLGATIFILGASYVVCHAFFMSQWEGWEAWHRRTGLDADRAEEAWQQRHK